MTAIILPIAPAAGVPIARNFEGEASGLAPTATATLVSIAAGSVRLRGFYVFGTTDGKAWVEIDGAMARGLERRINVVEQTAVVILPNPEPFPSPTSVVELRVRNEGGVAGDFRGRLLGE